MCDIHSPCLPLIKTSHVDRRRFLRLGLLGGGAALFLGARDASASGAAEALLLSCMDYRLVDDLTRYMDERGLTNKYDHVVLAGASAGATAEKFKDWHDTFWSHLQVAIDLHKIHKVIVIDHRDCGAYKLAFGAEHATDPDVEAAVHGAVLGRLARAIREKHKHIEVETLLMSLDGSVSSAGTKEAACAPAEAKSEAHADVEDIQDDIEKKLAEKSGEHTSDGGSLFSE